MLMPLYICLNIYAEQCLNYVNGLSASEKIQYSSHMQAFFQTYVYLFLTDTSTFINHKQK